MEKQVDANGLTEEEFLAQYNSDKYAKPSLTADIIVFKCYQQSNDIEVMLIRRKGHPFIEHWALPGGFAEPGETIEQTAARELEEETSVTGLKLNLVGVYSKPGRDPRGWTVSAAYMAVVKENEIKPVAADDAKEVGWGKILVDETGTKVMISDQCINNELAFDHEEIISDAAAQYVLSQSLRS